MKEKPKNITILSIVLLNTLAILGLRWLVFVAYIKMKFTKTKTLVFEMPGKKTGAVNPFLGQSTALNHKFVH